MSYVRLLAADRPAPLYQSPEPRTRLVQVGGRQISITEDGFSVMEHQYYRSAVDELELTMKPCQYELDLRGTEEDLRQFKDYLIQNFAPSEEVELWGLWVGGDEDRPARYRGDLKDLDMETLAMLEECRQVCLTIRISDPGRRN